MEIAALVLGTIGTLLGILNWIKTIRDNQIKILVNLIPVTEMRGDQAVAHCIAISIVNLSKFPIEVTQASIFTTDGNRIIGIGNREFPTVIDPMRSFIKRYSSDFHLQPEMSKACGVCVEVAGGSEKIYDKKGTKKLLVRLRELSG